MSEHPRAGSGAVAGIESRPVLVSSTASDAHTWNLVYVELLLGELGFEVVNLGACVPDGLLEAECLRLCPAMLALSSVNGHGYRDGLRVIRRLRALPELRGLRVVIGGKLGVGGPLATDETAELLHAGFDGVFDDHGGVTEFRRVVAELPRGPAGIRVRVQEAGA